MKKFFLLQLYSLLLLLVSCNRHDITGNWVYHLSEYEDGASVTINGTSRFEDDGHGHNQAKCLMEMRNEDEGVCVKFTFSMSSDIDWCINGDELVLSPVTADVYASNCNVYDLESGRLLGQWDDVEIKTMADEMRQELMKATTEKILMEQEDKFVTESNEDGKKTTCTYNRVK